MSPKVATTPISSLGFVPGESLDASQFSTKDLADAELLIAQFLSEEFPSIDFNREGTIYEHWVRPGAVEYLINRRLHETAQNSSTLKGIEEDPDGVDAGIAAAVLSNYLVSQNSGTSAVGQIKLVVSSNRAYRLSKGLSFSTEDGKVFVTTETVVTTSSTPGQDQVPLLAEGANLWYFLVPVSAAEPGESYNIPRGTRLSPSGAITSLVTASAFSSFSGGTNAEGFDGIRSRILRELSVRNLTSEFSLESTIRDSFPDLQYCSAVGMGSAVISRNRSPLIGTPIGGIVDVYVRTSTTPVYRTFEAEATLVEGELEIFKLSLGRDVAPGHYFVRSIRPSSLTFAGTYEIISSTRSINNLVSSTAAGVTSAESPNRISEVVQGGYSRWQENEVVFRASLTEPRNLDGGNLAVQVEVFVMPDIDAIQDLVSRRDIRVGGTDYLVRAFVPCLVSLSSIRVKVSQEEPGLESQIRGEIMSYVNSVRPGDGVRVDSIVAKIRAVPSVVSVDLPIKVTGTVYPPGIHPTEVIYSSRSVLQVPTEGTLGFGPENVAFFLESGDIPLEIST